MKEIYPDYADDVGFYAVGLHPGLKEEMVVLKAYKEQHGYPWVVATARSELMAELGVTIQSTKIAFDSNGTITYREGMGAGDDEAWRRVFTELSQSRQVSDAEP